MKTVREWLKETDPAKLTACLSARLFGTNQKLIKETSNEEVAEMINLFLSTQSVSARNTHRLGVFAAPQWKNDAYSIEVFIYPLDMLFYPPLPKERFHNASVGDVLDCFVMETTLTMSYIADLLAAIIESFLFSSQLFADFSLYQSIEKYIAQKKAQQEQLLSIIPHSGQKSRIWLDNIQKTTESLNWYLEKFEVRCAQRWLRENTSPTEE